LSLVILKSNFFNDSKTNLVIPLGISFYYIHGITYLIDIYHKKIYPEKNLFRYSLYINFFPLLISGPIERSTNLLPQFKNERKFNYETGVKGLKLILWGLFQKLVIADQCNIYTTQIIENYSLYSGATIYFSFIIYSIQIYSDFAGYSNVAIGISNLLGFSISTNFDFPYFTFSIKNFWRKWHISLSSLLRDYVYIPMGGNRLAYHSYIKNILIVFLLSGMWHGINMNFIIWGLYHFILYIIYDKLYILRFHLPSKSVRILKNKILNCFILFNTITFGWIFFRTNSINNISNIISKIFSKSFFNIPEIIPKETSLLIILYMSLEFIWYKKGLLFKNNQPSSLLQFFRYIVYILLLISILFYSTKEQVFIYSQF
jgi:D-alanyl-lipoteichoic acid acyltransferase DltB (MBOAT superfamily)